MCVERVNVRRRTFDDEDLARLRAVPLERAVQLLDLELRRDRHFAPVKDAGTERWHVSVGGGVYELLVTGTKWFDARVSKGGGGAVDLTMHLLGLDFVAAVKRLKAAGL